MCVLHVAPASPLFHSSPPPLRLCPSRRGTAGRGHDARLPGRSRPEGKRPHRCGLCFVGCCFSVEGGVGPALEHFSSTRVLDMSTSYLHVFADNIVVPRCAKACSAGGLWSQWPEIWFLLTISVDQSRLASCLYSVLGGVVCYVLLYFWSTFEPHAECRSTVLYRSSRGINPHPFTLVGDGPTYEGSCPAPHSIAQPPRARATEQTNVSMWLRWLTSSPSPRPLPLVVSPFSLSLSLASAVPGALQPSIGNLRALQSLDLSGNNFTGETRREKAPLLPLTVATHSYEQLCGRQSRPGYTVVLHRDPRRCARARAAGRP